MTVKEVKVPDIGGVESVDVIELSVQPGEIIEKEETLLVLESDKATIEVPAPFTGKVTQWLVEVGQSLKEGDKVAIMESSDSDSTEAESAGRSEPVQEAPAEQPPGEQPSASAAAVQSTVEISVPDIGGAENVEVIEVNVAPGDTLQAEDALIVLESDKATMEVPCPQAGTVEKLWVKVGDKVSQGSVIATLRVTDTPKPSTQSQGQSQQQSLEHKPEQPAREQGLQQASRSQTFVKPSKTVHAGPAVRRLARELGVDLAEVTPTGPRQRILKEDVHRYVHNRMTGQGESLTGGTGLPELPTIDFSRFGDTETVELSKINRVSASNLHRSWVHIPHVTQFDEADITELEAFRKSEGAQLKEQGVRLTLLAFLIKACVKSLQAFPKFNASLSVDGGSLILKKYFHIGIAVDTPNGLVVPVVKNADTKSVLEIAQELQVLSEKARNKKLSPADMQGGCFSISSLGGIGGTAFTPIVNWPEVAILGVSRSELKPKFKDGEFVPRLMLPLSLSYDHRVIDGADAARFTSFLSRQLADVRRLLL